MRERERERDEKVGRYRIIRESGKMASLTLTKTTETTKCYSSHVSHLICDPPREREREKYEQRLTVYVLHSRIKHPLHCIYL